MADADLTQVSVEDDRGRILTGMGESEESLRATIDEIADAKGEAPTEAVSVGETSPVSPASAQPASAGAQEPSRGKKRYSQLTSERDQEASKRAEAERERDELRERLRALETSRPAPAPAPADVSPAVPVPSAPAKFSYPTFDAALAQNPHLTWDEWNDDKQAARMRFELDQLNLDARIGQRIEADRASRTFRSTVDSMFDRGRQAYADFDAVRASGPGINVPLGSSREQDSQRAQLIASLPNAEHVFYAIAKDATVAQTLARLSDVQFGIALGQLAPAAAVVSPASTAPTDYVLPPPPMQPVGSGSKTTVASASDLAERAGEDYDSSGFREQLRKERGRR